MHHTGFTLDASHTSAHIGTLTQARNTELGMEACFTLNASRLRCFLWPRVQHRWYVHNTTLDALNVNSAVQGQ